MSDQAVQPEEEPVDGELVLPPGANPTDMQSLLQPSVGPGSPPLTDGTVRPDVLAVTAGLIRACGMMSTKAIGALDARDAKDYGQAALYFAQAVITIDPSRVDGGNHPDAVKQAQIPRDYDERDDRVQRPPRPGSVDRDHDGKIGEQ